ncbi:MAG: hypothetical protein ACRCZF_08525, partial [Gemmataceae bacterium]
MMEQSAAVNVAYQHLRDPFRRAEHLVQLQFGTRPIDQPRAGLPASQLFEFMELREQLESDAAAGVPTEKLLAPVRILLETRLQLFGAKLDTGGIDSAIAQTELDILRTYRSIIRDFESQGRLAQR